MSLPPLPEADRQVLAHMLATLLHVRRGDGASARLYLGLLSRDELIELAVRHAAYLVSLGAPSDEALRGLLAELAVAA